MEFSMFFLPIFVLAFFISSSTSCKICGCLQCPKDEEHSDTHAGCQKTCEDPNPIWNKKGVPGCICKGEYLRNSKGVCVHPDKCDCKGKNQEWKSGGDCEATCKNPFPKCSCKSHTKGCFCKNGFVRHKGECIKTCDCPCPANEIFSECNAGCQKSCQYPQGPLPCPEVCISGCICKEGFLRNSKGVCVPCDTCDCIGRNEEWKSGGSCEPSCKVPYPKCSCKSHAKGCFCKAGYLRYKGECIKPCDCPCGGKNEIFKEGGSCEPTCDNPEGICRCKSHILGCFCQDGYVRHKEQCIKPCDCPVKCKNANEEYKDGGECERSCVNLKPKCTCKSHKKGCFCKDGYVRYKGQCIKECDCPKCKANEIFTIGGICEASCDEPTKVCKCGVHLEGCYCLPGFVRHNGCCIKLCDCPVKCKNANEEYKDGGECEPSCTNPNPTCKCKSHKKGCFCKDGYVRYNGQCIKPCDCPVKCKNANEEYKDGGECERSCANLNPICKCKSHKKGCFCKDGYVRYKGQCIKSCDCPKCKTNEVYTIGGICEPSCKYPGKVCDCGVHFEGCYCKPGYVRHNGCCIKPCECPPDIPLLG